ncbi:DUF1349 domain-containing protein [Lutimonas sp.]|uniref:DUF1349 domain-containing protein n=1 Tax=Lutimonas sp. TaxID=1872403 RepID=UPI003D9B79F8
MVLIEFVKRTFLVVIICSVFFGQAACNENVKPAEKKKVVDNESFEGNDFQEFTKEDLHGFVWMHEPASFNIQDNVLQIEVGAKTDFFNDPGTGAITGTAPFLYKEQSGDFVATALVKPDFKDMWNAVSIMIYLNEKNWIKFAFENSDATGKGIVTVVTRDVSDDANGVILTNEDMIWLKIARKDNLYAMHWSTDGVDYKMARLAAMAPVDTVKVGIEAQCPAGEEALHEVLYFSLEKESVADLRKLQSN